MTLNVEGRARPSSRFHRQLSSSGTRSSYSQRMQPTILIVDDEKHTRDGLRRLLEDEYDVYVAEDIGGAISVLERETVDVLLTDIRLGSEDGMQLIERALKMPHRPVCIMMTAYGSVDTAVEAMKRGAYDFVTKPLNLDKIEILIARARRIGRFEQANGGTIFLDESGDIDPSTQVKLLRVMSEQRSFERVGGSQTLRADVRVIAATNKNLEQLVRDGKFRDDLYFRLNVVRITMPPLRSRKEDIPLLVRSFLRHFSKANEKPLLDITTDAMNTLLAYDWPGNVRELRTAIEHGVVMASGPKVTVRDLPRRIRESVGDAAGPIAVAQKVNPLDLAETEKRLISQALASTVGNITAAANQLGISRRTLHRKLNEMNSQGRNVREQARAAKKHSK